MMSVGQPAWEVVTVADRAEYWLESHWYFAVAYMILAVLAVAAMVVALGMGLIYGERKIAAHFQCRMGPMRVGYHGILQSIADTIKLLLKEDIVPERADKVLHLVGPFLTLVVTILILGVLPYSPLLQLADVSLGVLYLTALSGLSVLGLLLGGWSSNNKWSLLGGMRAAAQVISYEITATLALLVVTMFAGTLTLSGIVQSQAQGWWVWRAHGFGLLSMGLFMIAATAEINRTPFDIPEGESELTGGFHTEYSGLRFAFFFLAEFINMFVVAGITVTLFLGGWMPLRIGNWETFNNLMGLIPPSLWFLGKVVVMVFVLMWFRWTFPRMRVDQLMRLEWKFLLPIGFINLFAAAVIILCKWYFFPV